MSTSDISAPAKVDSRAVSLSSSAVSSSSSPSPSPLPVAAPFNPVSVPGLSAFTSYTAQPADIPLPSPLSALSSVSSTSVSPSTLPSPPSHGRDATVAEVTAAIAALSSSTTDSVLITHLVDHVEQRRQLAASPASSLSASPSPLQTSPDSTLELPASHVIDIIPAEAPAERAAVEAAPTQAEVAAELQHLRPSMDAHRGSVSVSGQSARDVELSQEHEEEARWMAHGDGFFHADGKEWPAIEDGSDSGPEAREAEEAKRSLTPQPVPEDKSDLHSTSAALSSGNAAQQRPAGAEHTSLSYEPPQSSPSLPPSLPPSPEPSPESMRPSPPRPHEAAPAPSASPTREQLEAEEAARRRRMLRRIGFALGEHDDDEEDDDDPHELSRSRSRREAKEPTVDAMGRVLRPVRPKVKTVKTRDKERREREKRREREERDRVTERERRWLSKDIQERIGSFPRGLLHAVLSCLLSSPPAPNLANASSVCLLPSPQHVLLDMAHLAPHHAAASSSLPDEISDALSSLLGLSSAVLSCDADTQPADLFYARREEEKYGAHSWASGSVSSASSASAYTGPLFSSVCVLHNVHLSGRALHSILVQAMRLKQVTIDGTLVNLPRVHLIVATHSSASSPVSPLPRHLLEQFLYDVMLDLGFPIALRTFLVSTQSLPPQPPLPYLTLMPSLMGVTVSHLIHQYMHDVIVTLRQHVRVSFGPSPAAAQSLAVAAVASAMMAGQGYVTPHEVDGVAETVLAHRIVLRQHARIPAGSKSARAGARAIIHHLLTKALVPPK